MEPASLPVGTGINKGPDQPTTWPAPEMTKTGAVPVQLYGRRDEKRLRRLTFSAIMGSESRAAEIAIGPAAGRPGRPAGRNGCWANQIQYQSGSAARQRWASDVKNGVNLTGCRRGRIDNGGCWLDVNISMVLPYNFLGYPVSKIGRQADLRTVPLRVAVTPEPLRWALRKSSGVGEGSHKSVVQGDREFLRIGAGCG